MLARARSGEVGIINAGADRCNDSVHYPPFPASAATRFIVRDGTAVVAGGLGVQRANEAASKDIPPRT
jgi:hypothetical protein